MQITIRNYHATYFKIRILSRVFNYKSSGLGPIEENVGGEQEHDGGADEREDGRPEEVDTEEKGGKDEAEAEPGRDFERDCDTDGEDGREEEGGETKNTREVSH